MGLALGFITPFIIMVILYFVRFRESTFAEFLSTSIQSKQMITFIGVWCLVGNIALFTYYINTGKDRTARGIFAITLIFGIGILVLKLFVKRGSI